MKFFKIFKKKQVPRQIRIPLLPLHNIYFIRKDPLPEKDLNIINISTTGVGFLKTPDTSWPREGSTVQGTLYFNSIQFHMELLIIRLTDSIVGCQFQKTPQQFTEHLQKYFEAETSGLNMTKVNPEILKPDPLGKPTWYSGKNNCSLYFVENSDQKIIKFYISFFSNYFEGSHTQTLQLYTPESEPTNEKIKHKGSEILSKEKTIGDQIPKDHIHFLERFLKQIPQLSKLQHQQLLELIHKK